MLKYCLQSKKYYENNKDQHTELVKKWQEENKENLNQYQKEYYEDNKEVIKEKSKLYYQQNKEDIKENNKIWYDENKEQIKLKQKEYKENNKEKLKEYDKQYVEANKEKIRLRQKEYREKNKETIKEKNKLYREKNKDKINEYFTLNKDTKKEYDKTRQKRLRKDAIYKLKSNIGSLIYNALKRKKTTKNKRTIEILGCSFEDFKIYLESKFEPWMSWENYGLYNGELNYGWDIDHIKPISKAITEEDVIKLNHYTNLQPLCSHVNRYIKKDSI